MEEEISQETNAGKSKNLERLLGIMRQLRDPETGCQWDLQQTFSSLIKYTIEEAYEVSDAVIRGNTLDIIEELGDLLLQVVFFSQIADEGSLFNFDNVVEAINEKLIRRHPHIFSKNKVFKTADEQKESWSKLKELENRYKVHNGKSLLSNITPNLPPLLKSKKIQEEVSRVGFDWENISEVVGKVREELDELSIAIGTNDQKYMEEEIGDLLFTIINLSRHIDVDCEIALLKANDKFISRFNELELDLRKENKKLSKSVKLDMERAWKNVKARSKVEK